MKWEALVYVDLNQATQLWFSFWVGECKRLVEYNFHNANALDNEGKILVIYYVVFFIV